MDLTIHGLGRPAPFPQHPGFEVLPCRSVCYPSFWVNVLWSLWVNHGGLGAGGGDSRWENVPRWVNQNCPSWIMLRWKMVHELSNVSNERFPVQLPVGRKLSSSFSFSLVLPSSLLKSDIGKNSSGQLKPHPLTHFVLHFCVGFRGSCLG